ncbi:MAG TPA: hypothetical protein VM686_30060 [Polyangiaceae bacterium]|jgi:hypothetical protein|nr:hypothetical protein [Polyangiaceae bacterium]
MRSLLPLLLLVSSCSAPAPADAAGGPFEVESEGGLCIADIDFAAGEVRRGENRFLVSLTHDEAEITSASGLMVAHGHGSEGTIVPGDPIEVSIDLFMVGRWDLSFELAIDEVSDRLEFSIDVP